MKTAVSIPDDIYRRAERLAHRTKRTRSRVFGDALSEYLNRHESDEVTEAMNAVIAEVGDHCDPFINAAAAHVLDRSEW